MRVIGTFNIGSARRSRSAPLRNSSWEPFQLPHAVPGRELWDQTNKEVFGIFCFQSRLVRTLRIFLLKMVLQIT